jgi:hypothetical protein
VLLFDVRDDYGSLLDVPLRLGRQRVEQRKPAVRAIETAPVVSFSEDGCTKRQKPTALQQRRGLDPSGNDGRLPTLMESFP